MKPTAPISAKRATARSEAACRADRAPEHQRLDPAERLLEPAIDEGTGHHRHGHRGRGVAGRDGVEAVDAGHIRADPKSPCGGEDRIGRQRDRGEQPERPQLQDAGKAGEQPLRLARGALGADRVADQKRGERGGDEKAARHDEHGGAPAEAGGGDGQGGCADEVAERSQPDEDRGQEGEAAGLGRPGEEEEARHEPACPTARPWPGRRERRRRCPPPWRR